MVIYIIVSVIAFLLGMQLWHRIIRSKCSM